MNNNIKNKILESIGKIHDKSEKCKLEASFFDSADKDLTLLSDYFGTTKSQSLIIAVIFSLAYRITSVEINDMTQHFECNPMKLLEFNDDFEQLRKMGIMKKERAMNMHHFESQKDHFTINEVISEAIIKNQPMPKLDKTRYKDVIEFLEGLYELGHQRDDEIKLTDESAVILEEHGLNIFSTKQKKENIISPNNITFKKLLFDEDKMKQLYTLKKLLKDEILIKTRERLAKKGLPKGINVILHGLPGTGKTETAMQLAKYTEREIIKVEISQSKSMWFGESEKLIKKIFTDYRAYSKDCDKVPILLFNEADALLTKRFQSGNSNTSQTENAIQNILLEELENFDGILFATTNLVGNLDAAFERRFLFKIEFDKPDMSVKARIWQTKIPALSEADCRSLATSFDFSGGQIDNIVRKSEIHEIIHGIKVELKGLIEYCREEMLERRQSKIGFNLSS